jgi:hypothetical protein
LEKKKINEEEKDLHIVGPFGGTVIGVRGAQRSNIVRLSIVVPGDDFDEARS